ncbi:bifunctional DNA primase/polymerase [Streptomyces sp. NPDC055186]
MTSTVDIAAAARAMGRGLALFPIPAGSRVLAPGWQRRATLDQAELPQLLADGGNVGVSCRASRVVALDLDAPSSSMRDWPSTFTVSTPRTGLHMYFRVPADCTIGSFSGLQSPLGPRIDVRGPGRRSGGYLVGPGSVVGGLPYLVVHDVPVVPLPGWITGRLQAQWQEAPPITCGN